MLSLGKMRRELKRLHEMHWPIIWVVAILCVLGMAMQYSAAGGNAHRFMIPQITKLAVALVLAAFIVLMHPKRLMALAYPAYIASVILLVVVEVTGVLGGGAQRWISVAGITLQPSELAKLGLILALARYFHGVNLEGRSHLSALLMPGILLLIPASLVLLQPNLGTASILLMIAYAMCFMAGIRWYYFVGTLLSALVSIPIIFQFLHPYQQRRVMTFLNPEADPLGSGYNIIQSKIAIGSGGFFGKGLVQGSQGQLDFLPEKQTDFIFTMLAEELGFFGGMTLLLLYGLLIGFAMMLAVRCRHIFGRMIAAGVATLLFVHVFINMGMVMGLLPVVGVPLPFLSYGGSFLMTIILACGLLMHVYMNKETSLPRHNRSAFG
jgi:rod shape determining protein RodA